MQRTVFESVPPHVEYSVTALGTSLNQALGPADWGERFAALRDRPSAADRFSGDARDAFTRR